MSNSLIIVVVIIGVSLIILLGCLMMFVMARLRRVMELQFETINKLLGAVRADQDRDKTSESS